MDSTFTSTDIMNTIESKSPVESRENVGDELLILWHETNQFTEIRLNAKNVAIQNLKEEVINKFNAISKEKIEKCRLFDLQGAELQACDAGREKIIVLSNCTTSSTSENNNGTELPPTILPTIPNGDLLDIPIPNATHFPISGQESNIRKLVNSGINCRLASFQELIQDRIMKLEQDQNLRQCQIEKQVRSIIDTIAKQSWNGSWDKSRNATITTNSMLEQTYEQDGDDSTFISTKNIKKEDKKDREPFSYVDGLDPLGTFSLSQDGDIYEGTNSSSSSFIDTFTGRVDSRNSVPRDFLHKEFSLDAGSFPAHDGLSDGDLVRSTKEQTVTNKITKKQPSSDSVSEYSSIFSEKDGLNDFNVLFGVASSIGTTSSLNPVEQREIKISNREEAGSRNVVGDILGLQSNAFSSHSLASANEKKKRKKRQSILKKPKKRIKDSIKRRFSKMLKTLKITMNR